MRTLALAFIFLGIFILGTDAASAAPWRAQYGDKGGINCGYYCFEQCIAALWGNGGLCRRNSFEDLYWTGRTTSRRYR